MEVKEVILTKHGTAESLKQRVMRIEDTETRDYLLNRVLPQMEWYKARADKNRDMYCYCVGTGIAASAMIPVLAVIADTLPVKTAIAALGTFVMAINAYVNMHDFHGLWVKYQSARETLLRTLHCYFTNAGVFSDEASQEEKNVMLIEALEGVIMQA